MGLRLGIVAGEASGDLLGAELIRATRERVPDVQFVGVTGARMRDAGCETWAEAEELAVMGLAEVVRHLPRLFRLRRHILERAAAAQLDGFVGIDAPEFNLRLAHRLRHDGLRTVQYVSPQVWAWRQGRVRTIGAACDLVLCLLPFETAFYAAHDVRAEFVGHPLADRVPLAVDRAGACARLGLPADRLWVAILPGSRRGEVARLGEDFARAAAWLAARRPGVAFVAPMANAPARTLFESAWQTGAPGVPVHVVDGDAQSAMVASRVVLVASGTATLEAMLCKRPMVVAYRLAAPTAFLLRSLGLVKVPYFAQPNLLAGRRVVPEFFQEAVTAEALGRGLARWLDDPAAVSALEQEFTAIHASLQVGGAARAADAILRLLGRADT
jgi:lipid-A-disaccharide synthase